MVKEIWTDRLKGDVNGRIFPILITLLALPALRPLFSRQFTCGFDNVFHLWRAVEIGALIREGIWFSRWAPHMAHGYGYPLYLYQSPLSAYLAALVNVLGFSWPVAINLIYGLGFLGSGIATWWLAREFWGDRGGLLSAVALIFAPFHLYVVYYRASLSETVAWIFPPLILWAIFRWQVKGQRVGLFTAVMSLLLLFYTHDVTGYIFLPLFLAWPFCLSWIFENKKGPWRGLTAVLLGFASAAFFWLPAILERDFIQFGRAGSAWPFLPQNNYLPLKNLFALPRNADPLLLNDWPERGLGFLLLILVVLGVGMGLRPAGKGRRLTAVFTLIFLSYLFLVSPLSSILWDNLSLLSAFQFPWRLLSPVVLMGSLMIGRIGKRHAASGVVTSFSFSLFTFYFLLLFLPLLHFGWLTPNHCDLPTHLTIEGMVDWEQATGTLGTTASRELLPTTVERLPQMEASTDVWQERIMLESLPDSATIEPLRISTMEALYHIESPKEFTAVYQALTFPGWRVTLNGHQTEITPSETNGLITVQIPAGQTRLHIFRGNTAVQNWGIGVSILALLGAGGLGLGIGGSGTNSQGSEHIHSPLRVNYSELIIIFLLAIGVFSLSFSTLFKRPKLQDGRLTTAPIQTDLTFGNPANPTQIKLLGHTQFPKSFAADTPLEITLFWKPLVPLERPYRVGLTVLDEQGIRWSEEGLRDYRWTRSAPPTTQWPVGQYTQTAFFLDLLSGTPPGQYDLQLTFFEVETLAPLTIFQDGNPVGPTISLGQLIVDAPQRPFTQQTMGGDFSQLDQLNYRFLVDRDQAIPGDNTLVTLFWQSGVDINAELRLLDTQNQVVAKNPINLTSSDKGLWRHQQFVRLPASLEDGVHQWQLSVNGETAVVGSIEINAPDRVLDQPEVDIIQSISLDNKVTFIGATLDIETLAENKKIDITLLWQAIQEMSISYRVFVQLLNSSGQIVAQSDGLPANWTRPTTGWQTGEFILDTHTLNIPESLLADDYMLIVGMYTLENGRLTTPDGTDHIIIPLEPPIIE